MEELFRATVSTFSKVTLTILYCYRNENCKFNRKLLFLLLTLPDGPFKNKITFFEFQFERIGSSSSSMIQQNSKTNIKVVKYFSDKFSSHGLILAKSRQFQATKSKITIRIFQQLKHFPKLRSSSSTQVTFKKIINFWILTICAQEDLADAFNKI
jgi:hypothetical protein